MLFSSNPTVSLSIYFYLFIFFISLILHASTMPFPIFHGSWLVRHTWCIFTFLLPFTVGWSVSGSDWPALVYSFGPGYGQWQWPSGAWFLSLQVMLMLGAIYRSILVSCRVLALVPQASWFILYVFYHNG